MKTSASYYRTVDWYSLSNQVRVDIHRYLRGCLPSDTVSAAAYDAAMAEVWQEKYRCVVQPYQHGWYLHFHDADGFATFALQCL